MSKIEKSLLIALISIGILGTSFMIGMGIKQEIDKNADKSYSDTYDKDTKVKTLDRIFYLLFLFNDKILV